MTPYTGTSRILSGWPSRKTWPLASATNTRSPVRWNWRPCASTKKDCPRPNRMKPPTVPPPDEPLKMAFADFDADGPIDGGGGTGAGEHEGGGEDGEDAGRCGHRWDSPRRIISRPKG